MDIKNLKELNVKENSVWVLALDSDIESYAQLHIIKTVSKIFEELGAHLVVMDSHSKLRPATSAEIHDLHYEKLSPFIAEDQ